MPSHDKAMDRITLSHLHTPAASSIALKVCRTAESLLHQELKNTPWRRSSVPTKLNSYLRTLTTGTKKQPLQGVPQQALNVAHRCFAQACLEHDAVGLNGQDTPWYSGAVEAARQHMQQES